MLPRNVKNRIAKVLALRLDQIADYNYRNPDPRYFRPTFFGLGEYIKRNGPTAYVFHIHTWGAHETLELDARQAAFLEHLA